jgi:hypothetical protein
MKLILSGIAQQIARLFGPSRKDTAAPDMLTLRGGKRASAVPKCTLYYDKYSWANYQVREPAVAAH